MKHLMCRTGLEKKSLTSSPRSLVNKQKTNSEADTPDDLHLTMICSKSATNEQFFCEFGWKKINFYFNFKTHISHQKLDLCMSLFTVDQ